MVSPRPAGIQVQPGSRCPRCSNPTLYGCGFTSLPRSSDARSSSRRPNPPSCARHKQWTIVRCLISAWPRYKLSCKCAVSPKKDSTVHSSHLDSVRLLPPSPGPDCPLTRMLDPELGPRGPSDPARGQTPLLRADVTPTWQSESESRSTQDRSRPPSEA